MPCSEISSQPGMLMQKFEGRITLEQLQSPANTHCGWHLNKQMDVVNGNMQFINFESVSVCNLSDEKFTIHPDSIKLHGVSGIFALPNKMEGILPKRMLSTFQIHFISPQNIAHAKSDNLVSGAQQSLSYFNRNQKLNFTGGRIPPVLESTGILRQM